MLTISTVVSPCRTPSGLQNVIHKIGMCNTHRSGLSSLYDTWVFILLTRFVFVSFSIRFSRCLHPTGNQQSRGLASTTANAGVRVPVSQKVFIKSSTSRCSRTMFTWMASLLLSISFVQCGSLFHTRNWTSDRLNPNPTPSQHIGEVLYRLLPPRSHF